MEDRPSDGACRCGGDGCTLWVENRIIIRETRCLDFPDFGSIVRKCTGFAFEPDPHANERIDVRYI
jgi:hypothetical protein